MSREILFFTAITYISGTIFLVALIELAFTVQRRKANNRLQHSYKEIKARFNQSINTIVLRDDAELEEAEKEVEEISTHVSEEKATIEKSFQDQIEELTKESNKALEAAKAKAKRLEQVAKIQADDYLRDRQKEVESELMNLVISVTKKVLPEGISYAGQKDLVMKALADIQTEKGN